MKIKKIVVLFLIFSFFSLARPELVEWIALSFSPLANAQTPNSSTEKDSDKIKQQFITNIASKVAELKLVEKRGIIGEVSDISNTQITLLDIKGNTRFIDVDELTKFSSPSQKGSFGISDITKGVTLGTLGLYNKESRRILSRFVNVISFPKFIHGVVSFLDDQNFTIEVKTKDKKFNVDVETTTRIYSYTEANNLSRAGFSKIKENQNIIVIGFPNSKDPNNIIASRTIFFPELLKNPNIIVVPKTKEQIIIPSTGSGKKLTPIIK